jgi:hypothetical protein
VGKRSKSRKESAHQEFVTAPARDDLPSPVEFLEDPLSKTCRLERRNLLIVSAVGALVAKAGLLPTRFTTLGLEFQSPEQRGLVVAAIALIVYFVLAFVIYGTTDFLIWRKTYQDYLESIVRLESTWTSEDQRASEEMFKRVTDIAWVYRLHPAAAARIVFELVFPIGAAIFAILLLAEKFGSL